MYTVRYGSWGVQTAFNDGFHTLIAGIQLPKYSSDFAPALATTDISNGFRHPLGDGTLTESRDGDGYYVPGPDEVYDGGNYGARYSASQPNTWHLGEDWNAEDGTDYGDDVFAASNGRVDQTGYLTGLGNYITIVHQLSESLFLDGAWRTEIVTLYAHLSEIDVAAGQVVSIGQKIGEVGDSGQAQGSHLHFEVRVGTQFHDTSGYADGRTDPIGWVDPTDFINSHRTLGQAVSFDITPLTQSTNEGGNLSFRIAIHNPNYGAVSGGAYKIFWHTNPTADHVASSSDYQAVPTNQQIIFSTTSAQYVDVSLHTYADNLVEGSEYFSVDLYDYLGAFLSGSEKVFTIVDVPPQSGPEIAVSGNGVNILDNDGNPSSSDFTNFGSVTQGGSAVTHTFTVTNTGTGTLTTSGLSLPSGFTLVEPLSSSIAAGGSDTFTVRLDTSSTGTKTGNISFTTNDGDENPFNFSIAGTVNAASPTDDYFADSSTSGVVTPGGQSLGNLEIANDRDWFKVQVTQGWTYTINLVGGSSPQPAPFLSDPKVYLYNSSSQYVDSNDDFNGLNSQLTFTAAYTGIYFIEAAAYADAYSGTYRLSVSAGTSPGTNIINGDAGANTLPGTSGADQINGLGGNDFLAGYGGNDTLDGGTDTDWASYGAATGGVAVTLGTSAAQNVGGGQGIDTLISIENLWGSNYGDLLIGNSGANRLFGSAGNDFLRGWGGNDILEGGTGTDWATYSTAAGAVVVNLALSGAQFVGGNEGTDTLISIENLFGSAYNDNLTGNAANNALVGGGGADILRGGGGQDFLTGGPASDRFTFDNVSDSAGMAFDTILDWDPVLDYIDLWFTVTGVDTTRSAASVSAIPGVMTASNLGVHHAALVNVGAATFLVVDANGAAGYQAGQDLIIRMDHVTSFHTYDFT